jgi:hypothetical protein
MLTPEQAQDLVDHFGSQGAAARETGVSRAVVQYGLDPKRWREKDRCYRRRNPEKYRESQRRYAKRNPEKIREKDNRYWHLRGGWVKKRKRKLAAQRADILSKLEELEQRKEAITSGTRRP